MAQTWAQKRKTDEVRWAPSLVRRLLRKPQVWWALVALMAGVTVSLVGGLTSEAAAAREQWGTEVEVIVATRTIETGELIVGAAERRTLPTMAVPEGAIDRFVSGQVARSRIHDGEVIVGARVSGADASGLAGRLPPGTSAVAVPSGSGWPPLAVGDLVDLHATLNQVSSGQAQTARVATRAVVVDVGDRAVTVAVPSDQVLATATALTRGVITVALVG